MAKSKTEEKPKAVTETATFKIDPELLKVAKEKCWQNRVTFSSQVEALVRTWTEKKA